MARDMQVLGYGNIMIQAIFVGSSLGPLYQSAWYLARLYYCLTGLSVVVGLAGALETFAGQAWGSSNPRLVGIFMQRALLITTLAWAACLPLYIKSSSVLAAMHQDPTVASLAALYCRQYIPSLLAAGVAECVKRSMVAQNLGTAVMLATLLPTLATPPTLHLLLRRWQWGLGGVAAATLLWHLQALALMIGALVLVESGRDRHQRSWQGPSRDSLRAWSPFLVVAGPSCVLLALDWGISEAAGFMAGWLPDSDTVLAVFGICMDVTSLLAMVCYGVGAAVAVRVANHLGAGCHAGAALAAKVAFGLGLGLGCLAAAVLVLLRRWYLPWMTGDDRVQQGAAEAMVPAALSLLGSSTYLALSGVLRGAGRQRLAVASYLLASYVVGVPLEAWAAFALGLGVLGIWWAQFVCTKVAPQAGTALLLVGVMGACVALLDWPAEREASRRRLQCHEDDSPCC